jgi:hypothetical protein
MENYKKMSFLLLFSTALTLNAHYTPSYDTSGNPGFDDFDDQSGGPLPLQRDRDYETTILEKEAEKYKPTTQPRCTPSLPTSPQQKGSNPSFEKQRQEEEKRQRQQDVEKKKRQAAEHERNANILASNLINLCTEIENRNEAIREVETAYERALNELTQQRTFSRSEKLGMALTAITGAGAFLTTSAQHAPKYLVVALLSAGATAWSYVPRYRSSHKAGKLLTSAHPALLENAATVTKRDGTSRTKTQLIAEAEETLRQLKATPGAAESKHELIQDLEAKLEELKA